MNTFADLPSQINKYIIRILNRSWTHFSFIRTAICSHLDRDAYSFGVSGNACPLPRVREGKFSFLPNSFSFSTLLLSPLLPTFDQRHGEKLESPGLATFYYFCFLTGRFLKKKSGNKDFKKGGSKFPAECYQWNEWNTFTLFMDLFG